MMSINCCYIYCVCGPPPKEIRTTARDSLLNQSGSGPNLFFEHRRCSWFTAEQQGDCQDVVKPGGHIVFSESPFGLQPSVGLPWLARTSFASAEPCLVKSLNIPNRSNIGLAYIALPQSICFVVTRVTVLQVSGEIWDTNQCCARAGLGCIHVPKWRAGLATAWIQERAMITPHIYLFCLPPPAVGGGFDNESAAVLCAPEAALPLSTRVSR
jgi:hypothetical protein